MFWKLALAPNSKFWISTCLLKKIFSFKQWVQYTNVLLKYLPAWWYFWCLLCFWFLSLVLANLCQEPITCLRYYFSLLFCFSLFVSFCSSLPQAFRGSARQAFLVKFSLILLLKFRQLTPPYRVFSLTWLASMQIYWNKRKRLHKKSVQLPQDPFGTPTWPPFHCFGTPIWPPWRHVKTLYNSYLIFITLVMLPCRCCGLIP